MANLGWQDRASAAATGWRSLSVVARCGLWLPLMASVACATPNSGAAEEGRQAESATEGSASEPGGLGQDVGSSQGESAAAAMDAKLARLHGRLERIPGDPIRDKIIRGTHDWVSNELSQGLFHPFIAKAGGLFMGVGTDQCYLLAGWQGAESLVLMDFDRYVVALHRAYRAFFLASKDPEEFVAWWHPENQDDAMVLLKESVEDEALRDLTLEAFNKSAKLVRLRLSRLKRQYGGDGMGSFVTDPEQFARIRALYRSNRVFLVDDKPIHRNRVGLAFRRLVKKAGIENFRFHDLRHDFCSRLIQAGEELSVVSELAGHSSIITTQRYAHLSPEAKRKAISSLEWLQFGFNQIKRPNRNRLSHCI